jgi:oxepin-CoA hydrolase/3-oxo-5,6-dehydrosuberyl-CoA semialdehyde dehydrogenase
MDTTKLAFITHEFPALLQQANATTTAKWGKMNFQQMIEHVASFFTISSNGLQFPLVSPIEHLPKLKEFLMSEKRVQRKYKSSRTSFTCRTIAFKI